MTTDLNKTTISTFKQTLLEPGRIYDVCESDSTKWMFDGILHLLICFETDTINKVMHNDELSADEIQKIEQYLELVKSIPDLSTDTKIFNSNKCRIMINTSNRCNLRCKYCYSNHNDSQVMTFDTAKQIFDFARYTYMPNANEYVFTYCMSSESTIDLALLKQIADYYPMLENYEFVDSDIEHTEQLYVALSKLVDNSSNLSCIELLNSLLSWDSDKLYNALNVTCAMPDCNEECSPANLIKSRLNRSLLELAFPDYIKHRDIKRFRIWFMTNGINITDEFIDFVKFCNIRTLWISLDGPELANINRIDAAGNHVYTKIVDSIKKLHNAGIQLYCSSVITPQYTDILSIIEHARQLGFNDMQIVETHSNVASPLCFTRDNINELLQNLDKFYTRLKFEMIRYDFSLFKFVRTSKYLRPFVSLLNREKSIKRCEYDEQLVIDASGDIYQCLYYASKHDNCQGNIWSSKRNLESFINDDVYVMNRHSCKQCALRYLCGGTCYFDARTISPLTDKYNVECILHKHIITRCLQLYVKMLETGIIDIIAKLYAA